MKTLTAALLAELGLVVTRPGFLVQIGYSVGLHLSTLGDISWAGQFWSATDIRVSGLGQDGGASSAAQITLGNADGAYGALILNEGASDIPVSIWAVYTGATASGDPVQRFAGVTNGASIDVSGQTVTLPLVAQGAGTLHSPRVFINKASGFNFLQPAGTKIVFGNETFVLGRG